MKMIDDMDEAYFEAWAKERAACQECRAESEAGKYLDGPCRHKHNAEPPIRWRPIESAPKEMDGTLVLVALIRNGKIWRVSDAAYSRLGWYTRSGEACHWRTHWAPMPELDA